jgi:hypothetical protein
MIKLDEYKTILKNAYNIDLTEEDYALYKKRMNKAAITEIIGIVLGAIIILFIVFGMVFALLPFDQYTFIPLIIVSCLTVMSANSLTKKMKTAEAKFIENVKKKYNVSAPVAPQPSTPQISRNEKPSTSGFIPSQPKAAAECPICHELIPVNSNPCSKCGAKLLWD